MPSFLDYLTATAPYAANALLQRRSAGNASRTLQGGVGQAQDRIVQSGADIQRMFDPYRRLGTENIDQLNAGLQPGGEFSPYGERFSFTGQDLQNEPGYQFTLQRGNEALEAVQKAMGTRFSGGAAKEALRYNQDYAGTKFNEGFNRAHTTFRTNEDTFRQNQTDRFNRLSGAVDTGARATDDAAGAQLISGQQLAELEMAKSEAEAAGDLGSANAIQQAIEGGLSAVQGLSLINALRGGGTAAATGAVTGASLAAGAAPTALSIPGLGAVTAGVPSLAALPSATAGALPGGVLSGGAIAAPALAPGAAAASAPLTGYAGGGLVTSQGAMIGMLTNPVTIGIAAGIVGVTALLKSQAHHEANTWVQGFQNKFDKNMDTINRQFHAAAQSGQLGKAEAQGLRAEVAEAMKQYEAKRQDFARQGSDEKTVAKQALETFNQHYGTNGAKTLDAMDRVIAGLA